MKSLRFITIILAATIFAVACGEGSSTIDVFPTHIGVEAMISSDASSGGLMKNSVILLEQVRTLDKTRLKEKMGHLDDSVMRRVNEAIAVSFGLGGTAPDEIIG